MNLLLEKDNPFNMEDASTSRQNLINQRKHSLRFRSLGIFSYVIVACGLKIETHFLNIKLSGTTV